MASAAELDGVSNAGHTWMSLVTIILNGLGLRTYSVLRVHVYVAGLYLERRSSDGDATLNSSQPKLLRFVFLRDVGEEDARKSWREEFDRNCPAPCGLPAVSIDRFLAAVPSVHNGDTSALLFTARKVDFLLNGRLLGRVADPDFVRVILATFIGRSPNSAEVKEGLLGAPG